MSRRGLLEFIGAGCLLVTGLGLLLVVALGLANNGNLSHPTINIDNENRQEIADARRTCAISKQLALIVTSSPDVSPMLVQRMNAYVADACKVSLVSAKGTSRSRTVSTSGDTTSAVAAPTPQRSNSVPPDPAATASPQPPPASSSPASSPSPSPVCLPDPIGCL